MKPAARRGDPCEHGGVILDGSPDTSIAGEPAARLLDPHDCPRHGPGPIAASSPSVLINRLGAARQGDRCDCGGSNAGGDGGGGGADVSVEPTANGGERCPHATGLREQLTPELRRALSEPVTRAPAGLSGADAAAAAAEARAGAPTAELTVGWGPPAAGKAVEARRVDGGEGVAFHATSAGGLVASLPEDVGVNTTSLPFVHWEVATEGGELRVHKGTAPTGATGSGGADPIVGGCATVLIGDTPPAYAPGPPPRRTRGAPP